jgi:hypothetical protein
MQTERREEMEILNNIEISEHFERLKLSNSRLQFSSLLSFSLVFRYIDNSRIFPNRLAAFFLSLLTRLTIKMLKLDKSVN